MVLSGVFEKFTKLKITLGHLRETLPFLVWRIHHTLARPDQKAMSLRDIFCNNFYVTTSGNFSNPAPLCCVREMRVDHVMFAVDWPFVARRHMDGRRAPLSRVAAFSRNSLRAIQPHLLQPPPSCRGPLAEAFTGDNLPNRRMQFTKIKCL
jgi:hypothetical protein